MLASLGLFVFETTAAAFDELSRKSGYRFGTGNAVGTRPHMQYIGQGNDDISLSGTLYPEITKGIASLDELRDMASTGKTYALMNGNGYYYGMCYITDISETQTHLLEDGSARKIGFSLSLKLADDSEREQVAILDQDRTGA
ncbi:tail assembly protein [Psychrobacter glaciei]|uniref:Tail assembly protein n=1 Tax=Psychrobacter glaciei TaxID=619771 RepID=A0ABQ3GLW8_9GAMM|nr:phage tail protein [Psychrobacter glaciei]GHD26004.1 tail assembly protein [Psychrobacter glaciei]